MKKMASLILALAIAVSSLIVWSTASANTPWGTSVMYVKTANGKSVYVRSEPRKGDNVIGSAAYGHQVLVDWSYAGNDGWTRVVWGSMGDGYIMSQFLVDTKPAPYKESKQPSAAEKEAEAEKKKLANELKGEKAAAEYFYIGVRPTRTSGWVNFRTGPSKSTSRIASFGQNKELLVMGETPNWYRAQDPETGKVGYIHKNYVTRLAKKYVTETETADGVRKLGVLNVNGEFNITCKLPEGYDIQVVNKNGTQIVASVLSEDMTRPQLYLSIAMDDSYSEIDRMNDMSEEDLLVLEESYKVMNDVGITYGETGYGTKLMIVRETGSDTDFVDILAIYKGYFIEFNMSPNPKAADQTLTDEQIQMCIDFLTDLDFTAA